LIQHEIDHLDGVLAVDRPYGLDPFLPAGGVEPDSLPRRALRSRPSRAPRASSHPCPASADTGQPDGDRASRIAPGAPAVRAPTSPVPRPIPRRGARAPSAVCSPVALHVLSRTAPHRRGAPSVFSLTKPAGAISICSPG
jgi:hypothetical protein